MKILALDSSSLVASVAVMEDKKLLGEYNVNNGLTHSKNLMPMLTELMKTLGLKPSDIDIYAASIGPGSFTGIRIGVTSIKAMAYATGKPVVSVPTLDALAYNAEGFDGVICPIMDARNNQVYTAAYRYEDGRQVRLTEYMGVPVPELVEILKGMDSKITFLGDGVYVHRDFLSGSLLDKCFFVPEINMMQRGASVAYAAFNDALEGKLQDAFSMLPFYLRKSQAERELENKSI